MGGLTLSVYLEAKLDESLGVDSRATYEIDKAPVPTIAASSVLSPPSLSELMWCVEFETLLISPNYFQTP